MKTGPAPTRDAWTDGQLQSERDPGQWKLRLYLRRHHGLHVHDRLDYAPDADCEDGSCEFALSVDSACIFDLDGSGFVGAYDLLIFLQYFEFNCN